MDTRAVVTATLLVLTHRGWAAGAAALEGGCEVTGPLSSYASATRCAVAHALAARVDRKLCAERGGGAGRAEGGRGGEDGLGQLEDREAPGTAYAPDMRCPVRGGVGLCTTEADFPVRADERVRLLQSSRSAAAATTHAHTLLCCSMPATWSMTGTQTCVGVLCDVCDALGVLRKFDSSFFFFFSSWLQPYDQAIRKSALGLFYSAKDRKVVLPAPSPPPSSLHPSVPPSR
eukprot:2287369-Rhodomonas_salina.1